MSPCLVWKFLTFLNRSKNNTSPKKAKIVVIFRQLLSFNGHDFRRSRKCASLFVNPSCDKILHDIFWQFLENWNLFLE